MMADLHFYCRIKQEKLSEYRRENLYIFLGNQLFYIVLDDKC